jgi:Family of unknown function (DUF6152)
MRIGLAIAVIVSSALTTATAFAHHSFSAEFDLEKPVRLTGIVTKLEWTNPHAWFYIDVKDESGKVVNWGWELGSPNGLLRTGWTRNSLKIGTEVTVEGSRARDGGNTANARSIIVTSTGQKLFAASSQPQ